MKTILIHLRRLAIFLRCKFGRHDWVRQIASVTFEDRGRLCVNCGKKQHFVIDRGEDECYWVDTKTPPKEAE